MAGAEKRHGCFINEELLMRKEHTSNTLVIKRAAFVRGNAESLTKRKTNGRACIMRRVSTHLVIRTVTSLLWIACMKGCAGRVTNRREYRSMHDAHSPVSLLPSKVSIIRSMRGIGRENALDAGLGGLALD